MRTFLVILSLIYSTYSYNFLVFCPLFGHSHTKFFATIADALTDAGHNVTFFTPTIVEKYRNVSYTKLTKDVVHMDAPKKLMEYGEQMESADFSRFWTEDSSFYNVGAADLYRCSIRLNGLFKFTLMDYLNIKTFIPSLSLTHDVYLSKAIGEPVMPSVVSDVCSPFGDKLSLLERAFNAFAVPYIDIVLGYPVHNTLSAPYTEIDIRTIEPEASFLFLNSNPFLDFPRPTLTKTVEIGGITVDLNQLKSQQLDSKWSDILNLREKTMLVSFGSVFFSKDMPLENKKVIANSMTEFKNVTFIWKYEGNDIEDFARGIQNIHFVKWVPQTALLANRRLSAFFTHAGLGSINEVSYLGKPSILCPLFADQMRNAKMLVRHNGSIELSKYDLGNSKKIIEAFQAILFDSSYAENAQKLAEQLENQPIKPEKMMVKHAEFAARFGRLPSLDPYSRKMSFVEYFLLDVATICVLVLACVVFVLTRVVQFLCRRFLVKIKTE